MTKWIVALALAGAVPGTALAQAPQTVAAPADPAREAAAQRVVVKLIPPGTYRRVMRDMFPSMMDALFNSMGGLTGADFGKPEKDGKTFAQAMAESDPAFRERMSIMTRIMGEEMGPVMDAIEPGVRAALSRAFARRFTLAQLNDLEGFFATPTGTAFGREFMAAFMDPEMMQEMGAMMPEMMKIMPKLMQRFEAETAHLPPLPKKGAQPEKPDAQ
ncbi:MAG: DUF2059 domain-containing protein [Sphingomonadales bacterium]|nr:MAG: DUF2059 domain-containing protein [Sphingomonadales bacterium]